MRLLKLVSLVTTMVLVTSVQAQDLKIHVNQKGKIGYVDGQGNEIVKCIYDSGQPFYDGAAIVTKAGKYGIIDATGQVLLPLKYTQILKWNDKLYLLKQGKKMGLSNHQGSIILPVNYSNISKLNCYGKAIISLGGKETPNEGKTYMANAKYGIIDDNGTILVSPTYKGIYEFSYDVNNINPYHEGKRLGYSYHYTSDTLQTDCSYIGFNNNGYNIYNAGIMDANGSIVLNAGLYYFVTQPQNGIIRYFNQQKKITNCGFFNINTGKELETGVYNNTIDQIKFWTHGDFYGDIAPVNGDKWSFIDKDGNKVRTDYTSLSHSKEKGLWAAKNNSGTWDVFDDNNNNLTALSGYEEISFPINKEDQDIFSVKKDGKWGFINKSGEIVVPLEYDKAASNKFDFLPVKKNGKWGLLSVKGSVIVPTEYIDIKLPTEKDVKHIWVKKTDSLYYHYNTQKGRVTGKGYKFAGNFKNGIAVIQTAGMTVENTPINRAQMYKPNTKIATINAVNAAEHAKSFVYLINTDDQIVMDKPVSTIYMDAVKKEIISRGGKSLTESEKKNMLLGVTKENRSYDLESAIGEDEWNY